MTEREFTEIEQEVRAGPYILTPQLAEKLRETIATGFQREDDPNKIFQDEKTRRWYVHRYEDIKTRAEHDAQWFAEGGHHNAAWVASEIAQSAEELLHKFGVNRD